MIRCPNCGTLNRDASRFCNDCGTRLLQTQIRCPMCGTSNPVGTIFCDRCHARLVPLEGVVPPGEEKELREESSPRLQGISLPTRSPGGQDESISATHTTGEWLADLLSSSREESPDDELAPSELPDWLAGVSQADLEEDAELDQVGAGTALPDWLSGLAPAEPEEEDASEPAAAAALPDWLSGLAPGEPEEEDTSEPAAAAAVLPDWLSGLAPAEPEEEDASEPAGDAALPDWLRPMPSESKAKPSARSVPMPSKSEAKPPARSAPMRATEELPDWLSNFAPATAAEASVALPALNEMETPDWLSDVAADEKSGSVPVFSAEPSPVEAIPDWLRQVAPSSPTAGRPAAPAFTSQEGVEEAETPETEGYLALETPPASAEVPDWLLQLGPAPDDAVVEAHTPLPTNLQQARMPSWLEGLKPPGTGPLPPLDEVEDVELAGAESLGLIRAEIPDWLQHYRPSGDAGAGAFDEASLAPAEVEGPLAGLKSTLPALAMVDMPGGYMRQSWGKPPEEVVAGAQLWQQILEQPRGAKRVVTTTRQKPGLGAAIVRWSVSILLILAALLGVAGILPELSSQIEGTPAGTLALRAALDELPAEATVILALEYGPAEASELKYIAEALLAHLAERQARVVGVSTLPEGVGLLQTCFAGPAWDSTHFINAGYIPGGASGIAEFLLTSDQVADAHFMIVLAARSDRLRWWVEQNQAGRKPLPVLAGLSAKIGPLLSPYLNIQGVAGWMIGLPDAAVYARLRGAQELTVVSLTRQLDALMLTQWVAAGLLLAGALYYLIAGKKGAG